MVIFFSLVNDEFYQFFSFRFVVSSLKNVMLWAS